MSALVTHYDPSGPVVNLSPKDIWLVSPIEFSTQFHRRENHEFFYCVICYVFLRLYKINIVNMNMNQTGLLSKVAQLNFGLIIILIYTTILT